MGNVLDTAHIDLTNKMSNKILYIFHYGFFKVTNNLFSLKGQQSQNYLGFFLVFFLFSDVLALPIFKQEDSSLPQENETKHPPFQYVMCAATSPAVKLYDETLTYLNQGWYTYVNAACGASLKLEWYFMF